MGELPEVEILEHGAKIVWIKGEPADGIWRHKDRLNVWLSFDEAVDGTLGYGFGIPPKDYSKDELLQTIKKEGEAVLKRMMEEKRQAHERRAHQEAKREELNRLGAQLLDSLKQ